jgi:hypothetical protein
LLTEINHGGYESLWFPFGRETSQDYLREGWDTSGKKDLIRIHDWLVSQGHRVQCALVCRHVHAMEMGEAPYDPHDPQLELYRWVSTNQQALQASRLVAWDFSRLVNVARWGFTAGYIDENIAWQWILEASRALQESYSTWTEIGEDFLLGFSFWAGGKPPEDQLIEANKRLCGANDSPWRSTPWRMPL